MNRNDTTDTERVYDEEIGAFLARESARRAGPQAANTEVVAAIRGRGGRRRPTGAMAGVAAATLIVGIVLSAWIVKFSTDIVSSPPRGSSVLPLRLPAVAAGEPCPVSQPTPHGKGQASLLGDGPAQVAMANSAGTVFFEVTPGGRWKAIDALWTAGPDFTGSVLARGARLDGAGEVRFGDASDPVRELRIAWSGQSSTLNDRLLLASVPLRVNDAGCYGLQIDADGGSSIVIFEARPIEDASAQLERPLQLPAAGLAECPLTPRTGSVSFVGGAVGDGPLYVAPGGSFRIADTRQTGGYWFVREFWVADPEEPGPILVRGGRIDAPGDLRFGDGPGPAGELRLPIHSYTRAGGQPPGWRMFVGYLRPPSPGCYAMQLDTLTASHWIVFEVTP